jgi:hypothetical protein
MVAQAGWQLPLVCHSAAKTHPGSTKALRPPLSGGEEAEGFADTQSYLQRTPAEELKEAVGFVTDRLNMVLAKIIFLKLSMGALVSQET